MLLKGVVVNCIAVFVAYTTDTCIFEFTYVYVVLVPCFSLSFMAIIFLILRWNY